MQRCGIGASSWLPLSRSPARGVNSNRPFCPPRGAHSRTWKLLHAVSHPRVNTCGTSCETGSVIDARTGKVIDLPGSICCEPADSVDDKFDGLLLAGIAGYLYCPVSSASRVSREPTFTCWKMVDSSTWPTLLLKREIPCRKLNHPRRGRHRKPRKGTPSLRKQASQPRDRTVDALSQCFAREYPLNRYSSLDGGHSSLVLLSDAVKSGMLRRVDAK